MPYFQKGIKILNIQSFFHTNHDETYLKFQFKAYFPEMLAMMWGKRTVNTGAELRISYSLPSIAWEARLSRLEILSATFTVIDNADLWEITWAMLTVELLIAWEKLAFLKHMSSSYELLKGTQNHIYIYIFKTTSPCGAYFQERYSIKYYRIGSNYLITQVIAVYEIFVLQTFYVVRTLINPLS